MFHGSQLASSQGIKIYWLPFPPLRSVPTYSTTARLSKLLVTDGQPVCRNQPQMRLLANKVQPDWSHVMTHESKEIVRHNFRQVKSWGNKTWSPDGPTRRLESLRLQRWMTWHICWKMFRISSNQKSPQTTPDIRTCFRGWLPSAHGAVLRQKHWRLGITCWAHLGPQDADSRPDGPDFLQLLGRCKGEMGKFWIFGFR